MSVGVSVSVGVVLDVCVGVFVVASVCVNIPRSVEVGARSVIVDGGVVDIGVKVRATEEGAASNTAPTMTKFTAVVAVRIAATMRRVVSRKQIFFSQCMDHSYSSGSGHWSIGQNSKIPFLVWSISRSACDRLCMALLARKTPSNRIKIKIAM